MNMENIEIGGTGSPAPKDRSGNRNEIWALKAAVEHDNIRSYVEDIVRDVLSSLKIYVVESEITDAQNSVRAVVEQAKL